MSLGDEYLSILKGLNGDLQGREKALNYLLDTDVDAHGEPLNFSYIPYLVDKEFNDKLEYIVSITHSILTKIIAGYLKNSDYRKLFGYSKDLERLILMPCGYSELLPMARFDIFINEDTGDFKFCEFNTDGTSCMSRDLVLGECVKQGSAFKKFSEKHKVSNFELFDSWAKACLKDYHECEKSCKQPVVAIADFMDEHATFSDFNRFKEAFERQGAKAVVADLRDLKLVNDRLVDVKSGTAIDCIYRRAVTCDILSNMDEVADFVEAVERQKVCLIGHFRTTVVHTKTVNIALFLPETRQFLNPEECSFIDEHCPKTFRLNDEMPFSVEDIKNNPKNWIIKPEDDYGAKGVFAGRDYSDDEWGKIVEEHTNSGYLAQEYAQQYTTDVLFTGERLDNTTPVQRFNAMPGLYSYNGKFSGIYLRCGNEGVIAVDHNGLVKPAFKVDF